MKFNKITFTLVIITTCLFSNSGKKDFFSGGMAAHFGYSTIENNYGKFSGPAFGLGGMLHFYLNPYLRVGSGGASAWMNYESTVSEGSHMRLGYGGITAETSIPIKEWRISAGILLGGGSYKNIHLTSINADGNSSGTYIEKGTFIFSPLLSVERNLKSSLKLFMVGDYLIGKNISLKGNFGGPKFLMGILFRK